MRYRVVVANLLAICGVLSTAALCSGQANEFKELATRIPNDANLIVTIDAPALFDSAMGKENNWRQDYADQFNASPLVLPPSTNKAILASNLEIEALAPTWEAISLTVTEAIPLDLISERSGGVIDTLAGKNSVWTPRRACIVEIKPDTFAALSPVSRQQAGRWITRTPHQLSDFLSDSIDTLSADGPQIRMSLDLTNFVRPEDIRPLIAQSPLVAESQVDRVTDLMAGVRGVQLDVKVNNEITGTFRVVFSDDVTVLRPVAKKVVLGTLDKIGASLEEMDEWAPNTRGKEISLTGALTPVGLRRFLSLVGVENGVVDATSEPVASKPIVPPNPSDIPRTTDDKPDVGKATYRYYLGVAKLLDDLARPRRVQSLDQIALWMRNYARKIERLDTRNVDPDMVTFGQSVANNLYNAVYAMHGINERAADRISDETPSQKINVAAVPTWRTVNYGGYRMREYAPMAWGKVDLGAGEKNQKILKEEQEKAMEQAQEYLNKIQGDVDAMTQTMQERYPEYFQ